MGKSDEKLTKKRVHKAAYGEGKHNNKPSVDTIRSSPFGTSFEDTDAAIRRHKAADGEGKHNNKPSVDTINSSPFGTTFEDTDAAIRRHKAADGEGKHNNKPSVDTVRSSPFGTTFEDTDAAIRRRSQWRDHFRQLCEYKVQFGHCLVPKQYSANPKLGQWVSDQRAQYRENSEEKVTSMSAEHNRALDGIGFDWLITNETNLASIWRVRFQQMCEFKVQFGHNSVPIKYSANPELGPWVSKQRYHCRLYLEGRPSYMTAERIRELESVGFECGTSSAALWNERFEQIREFNMQIGHCLVPRKYSANPQLGMWVANQRNNYRFYQEGKPSPMTMERIRELESVGFEWEPNDHSWNARFDQLCEYMEQFGDCMVPRKYSANLKLGLWVSKQRSDYRLYQEGKPSSMTAERIRELQSIRFEWETARGYWSLRLRQMGEFKVEFGHCLVPLKYAANLKLGSWVSNQRSNYRLYQEGKPSHMTMERIRELESAGFEWEPNDHTWNARFDQLCEYMEQFGDCLVPLKYSTNPKLGMWVSTQRYTYRLYKEGKPSPMTMERIRELQSLQFEFEPHDLAWNERFDQLCEYMEQFGHGFTPLKYSTNPKLGQWVASQRRNYRLHQEGKPSIMTAARIRELESVGFEWETTRGVWNLRFRQMREFKVEFGHCRVPRKYSANPKLGQWVSTQRSTFSSYQKGKPSPMTAERIRELESLEFEWSAKQLN
jgi:hypothetical protein